MCKAARTGGFTIQAGQAAIQMSLREAGDFGALQRLLDQINPPARTVEFVAQQLIGGTGRIAESAVHAFAQDGLRRFALRGALEFGTQLGLHAGQSSAYIRPRLKMRCGSKACFNSR